MKKWTVEQTGQHDEAGYMVMSGRECVASVSNLRGDGRINANLIAAAPELLDQNKRLRAALSLIANSDEFKGGTFVRELQLIAREALQIAGMDTLKGE